MLEVGIDHVLHATAGRCLPERGLQLHGLTSGKVPALSLCCTMQRHVHSLRSVVGIDASATKKHWRSAFGLTAAWCVISRGPPLRCEHLRMPLNRRCTVVLLDNQLHFGSMRHSFGLCFYTLQLCLTVLLTGRNRVLLFVIGNCIICILAAVSAYDVPTPAAATI